MIYIPQYYAIYLKKDNKANFTKGNGIFISHQSNFKENIISYGWEKILP